MSTIPNREKTIDLDAPRTLPLDSKETESDSANSSKKNGVDATVAIVPEPPNATIEHGVAPPPTTDITLDHSPISSATTDSEHPESAAKRSETNAAIPQVPGYEVLGVLGRGGMGVVYKARQAKLNRLVALKMVLGGAHASPDQLARFFTEAEAVAHLQHPNIVQIHEVGEFEGLPFFSLEYVSGGTLAEKIGGKPQPPRDAADVIELLACAMAVAHERGIIHRDLKPANVLLDPEGLPKITDFGLAKQIESDSNQTKSGTLMGTPSYMSPEQARGETREIGPPSDLYSLGAILYELLTGRPPFVGPTILETIVQVRNQEPVPPTRLQPKVPRDLETICLKCLQKEPRQRYASCSDLADDLHRFSAGEPIQARPVGWLERSWRWCRRNPRVAALSACLGVLVLMVIASMGFVAVRLNQEREALVETRKAAGERLDQAAQRVAVGNYRQARELLQWSDPLLGHADLADMRTRLQTLKAQVDVYAEFHQLLDSARFACRFGSQKQKEEGRDYCHKLLALYDEILEQKGRGAFGLPRLDEQQGQLFKEDAFEALLTAAQIEQEWAAGGDEGAKRQAATTALGWFNRAEQLLPGTRALHAHRSSCWATLGNGEASQSDKDKALAITPASAVDHFWHGFANHLRGDEALRDKNVKAANEFYQKEIAGYAAFLQLRPESFWGFFNWANAHVKLGQPGDLQDALIGYTACISLRPDFPWPYNNRGNVHLRLGQLNLAVADCSDALAKNQDYTEAHRNLGLAYAALGNADLALAEFNKAIAANPDYAPTYLDRAEAYLKRNNDPLADQDFARFLALTSDRQLLLERRSAVYRGLNRLDDAVQDYGELIALSPTNLQLRAERADLLLALGRHAAALEDFDAILEHAPGAASIWRARGIVKWQNLKDFDGALADLARFHEFGAQDAEPYRFVGGILLGRRQYSAALEALHKATTLRPGYPEAIWARSQIYLRLGRAAEALNELDPLVEKLPDGPPETLNVRAGVYQALGKLSEAAADYSRMIGLMPEEPDAYVGLAHIYEKQGQPAEAAECLDRLVAAAPQSMWAFVRRAEQRRDRGDLDAALADCEQAAKLAPKSAVPELVRASVVAARGEPAAAVAQAERLLKTAPPDDGHVLFAAACVWSLAAGATKDPAQSKQYADRAAEFLAQTLSKGFHDLNYPEHNRMASERALAPIQHLPSVRALLKGHGPVSTDK